VSEPDQPHIRLPHVAATPISRFRRAKAQEDETILNGGILGQDRDRFVHLDPPGLIKPRKMAGFVEVDRLRRFS
ncbi:hypothetical protein VQ044_25100, partial [Aurantimonas sp. C2-5-R2]|uniref:hypothetical protein n=1 Tax=Aurantimonas sp. C2-5-R2 TaxID=3113713 RepID=UPI002F9520D2